VKYFRIISLLLLLPALSLFGGELERLETLKAALSEQKIPWEERSLLAEYGGFGVSLLVRPDRTGQVPEPGDGTVSFVLAVPITGQGELPGDGQGELPLRFAAALSFIEKSRQLAIPRPEIIVAFLGDEGTALPRELVKRPRRGLEDMLSSLDDPEQTVLWYLDIGSGEAPGALEISHGTGEGIASLGIIRQIPGLCAGLSIPWAFATPFNGLYKLRLLGGPPVLRRAFEADTDALYITASYRAGASPALNGENLGEFIHRYTASLDRSGERDRHYAMVQFPPATFFLSEYAIAVFFLVGSAVSLLLILIFRAKRQRLFSSAGVSGIAIMAVTAIGVLVSGFIDISFIPLWAAAFIFVLPGGILHKPLPLFVGTGLALAYVLWVGFFFFRQRDLPAENPPLVRSLEISPRGGGEIEGIEEFSASLLSRELLGLRSIDLTLRSRDRPLRFDVSLVSSGPEILVHSAPVPFELSNDNSTAEFFLGEDPSNPLRMEIYLSNDFNGTLRAEALYAATEKGEYLRAVREIPLR
jgi:hypothetical protein